MFRNTRELVEISAIVLSLMYKRYSKVFQMAEEINFIQEEEDEKSVKYCGF